MSLTLLRRALSRPGFLSMATRRRFVWCLHDVSERTDPAHSPLYSTSPDQLREHIDRLSPFLDWVPIDQVFTPEPAGRRPIAAITFDDGFRSVKDVAAPILDAAGIPFAIFVCKLAAERNCLPITTRHLIGNNPTWRQRFSDLLPASSKGYGFIQPQLDEDLIARINEIERAGVLKERIYLLPEEIRSLHSRGVTVGSHSATHRVLQTLTAQALADEIRTNEEFLVGLGITSRLFALPFGKLEHYSPAVLDALRDHGYSTVFTTNPRDHVPNGASFSLVPRISVAGQSTEELSFSMLRTAFQEINL